MPQLPMIQSRDQGYIFRSASNLIRNNHDVEGDLPECKYPQICTEPENWWELGRSWCLVASGTGTQVVRDD